MYISSKNALSGSLLKIKYVLQRSLTLTAVAVSPAVVDPIPVVRTDLTAKRDAA